MSLNLGLGNFYTVPSDTVKLVYYRYDDEESVQHPRWWLNWITAKMTRSDYIHVEMVFSDGVIYGIQMGTAIRRNDDKSYQTNRYTCQEITTDIVQTAHMRNFLDRCIAKPSGFNYWGFYLLPIWPHSGAKKNKWFCSELVATALSCGGIYFQDYPPHTISPGKLFELLKNRGIGYVSPMIHSETKALIV